MKERMKNKVTYVDVMLNGRFYRQLKYSYCPLFPIRLDGVYRNTLPNVTG